MIQKTAPMIRIAIRAIHQFSLIGFVVLTTGTGHAVKAQEGAGQANINSSIGSDGTGTIIVEARGQLPEPPVFYSAKSSANVIVGADRVEQTIQLTVKVIQGHAKTLSFGLNGVGDVFEVQGENLLSWAIRQEGTARYLDLHIGEKVSDFVAQIRVRSEEYSLPTTIDLVHLTPGASVGFDGSVAVQYTAGVVGSATVANGFSPLEKSDGSERFQTSMGGQLTLALNRDGALLTPVDLVNTTLRGELHENGKSIHFQMQTTAKVNEANAEVTILSGKAAVNVMPKNDRFRLKLSMDAGVPVYKLVFSEVGTFSVDLDFVATLSPPDSNGVGVDFTIAASAIVPMTLAGLASDLEFQQVPESVVPVLSSEVWTGFLPATGRCKLQWKASRKSGEGQLFFTTTGHVETRVGAGLLHQEHQIDYHVLQGELTALRMAISGPGEILDVQGENIVAWNVVGGAEDRQLEITLSQPVAKNSQIKVRSQTPLEAFPVRVEGLRLNPVSAIRHSGYLRISNSGLVRLEPTGLSGLTQLAPEQFPGEPIEARQIFVYRFPSADHAFSVIADRIQPEVNLSELVVYQLAETDRVISADIEFDIREAPIRDWDFLVPADYSVVAVTGASVADYIASSEVNEGRRNLKVIFGQDVEGRQLITLLLEKSEVAVEGEWMLPRIEYPGAKSVRGDIGVMGAPGFRIAVESTDLLVEKPLSYFPKPSVELQQAFRIRDLGWSATMRVELLARSVQSDVFHLYSLSEETVYGSALINYFVTGAPVNEWRIEVPESLGNVIVDGQDVRTWRREGDTLIVSLHHPVMGAYTLLVTFEEKPAAGTGIFRAGQVVPSGVQGERGYIQVVSPVQVEMKTISLSDEILKLDPLELPAEFQLLSTAPPLGTWQYTERPFELTLNVKWFQPGTTVTQIVEFSEASSRVSQDGELVTDVVYYVKSRGQRTLRLQLPKAPVRLWEVAVNGQPVTARQTDDAVLIPLQGGLDPNEPVEVSVRLGKPTVLEGNPELALPIVFAPVLKTQWNIVGDEKHVLIPGAGTVSPPMPVLRPSGFDWVSKQGIVPLLAIGLFTGIGIWGRGFSGFFRVIGLLGLVIAMWIAVATGMAAYAQLGPLPPLQVSLPVLSSGENIELQVRNIPFWQVNISWNGVIALATGIASLVLSFSTSDAGLGRLMRLIGYLLIGLGVLFQGDAAHWFFALLGAVILLFLFIPLAKDSLHRMFRWFHRRLAAYRSRKRIRSLDSNGNAVAGDTGTGAAGAAVSTVLFLAIALSANRPSVAAEPTLFESANSVQQRWNITHQNLRLEASGRMTISGKPGDQFILLHAPAVLTQFEGKSLRLSKREIAGVGLTYIVSILGSEEVAELGEPPVPDSSSDYEATFEYQLESLTPVEGMRVLTGNAAVQEIDFRYDEAGWDVHSPSAVRVETVEAEDATEAKVLLSPGSASLYLRPMARDLTREATQFFVEVANLYIPGPGVVDGRHRIHVRTSQGQVSFLNVVVPQGLTVSSVAGPIGSWQFDAESGQLKMEIEPQQSQTFDLLIETQRGLESLPAEIRLSPLKVEGAAGDVGLLGVAFGPEAQPEKMEATEMSMVNLGDFDSSLLPNDQAVLHRVYRYGVAGGEVETRVVLVDSEVRVQSKQVLSLGDERVILAVSFDAEISRAGLFQLSFPLPVGMEVESLSGAALHHWAELTEGERRQIVMHLNGKTIGPQSFTLTLSGSAPTEIGDWQIPKFELNEATRQSGELVVQPTTGTRLRTVSRQNVSESDPRAVGATAQGALAFRLLQRDWNLMLGIERLDPWVTGQLLHETTMREGQTRTVLIANFNVQNASVQSLQVMLPVTDADEIKTIRASGNEVSDFVRTAGDSNIWELRFERRVVGKVDFRIEYERRGDRKNESESLQVVGFPEARQLAYYLSIRAGGRLELEHDALSPGWQLVDWSTVPTQLRDAENRVAPVFTFRVVNPPSALVVRAKRHALADALKLRIAKGTLTTVLSPTGDQLTAVDVTVDVIQRSSLSVGLPLGGELFSIFVNGESVHSIRTEENANTWQFYILPGMDDRTAHVRFVYSVAGERLSQLTLLSPNLNVPLENIEWSVIAPVGYELTDNDGNLELVGQTNQATYDRDSYLSKVRGKRQSQAQQATQLLEQANQLLQAGEQTKARWALNSVANQYALDAASNEDARVQLENLQTQQAIVGLNTRRQRLYLYNNRNDVAAGDNKQLWEAAADNPILQENQLNFRPQQLSELLRGNTTEDNAVLQQIAGRLVHHQRAMEPAPQEIIISLPEEGEAYTFSRTVQVAENAPLELDLHFGLQSRLRLWQTLAVLMLLVACAAGLAYFSSRKLPQQA